MKIIMKINLINNSPKHSPDHYKYSKTFLTYSKYSKIFSITILDELNLIRNMPEILTEIKPKSR